MGIPALSWWVRIEKNMGVYDADNGTLWAMGGMVI